MANDVKTAGMAEAATSSAAGCGAVALGVALASMSKASSRLLSMRELAVQAMEISAGATIDDITAQAAKLDAIVSMSEQLGMLLDWTANQIGGKGFTTIEAWLGTERDAESLRNVDEAAEVSE